MDQSESKSVEFLRSENDTLREKISVLESSNQDRESSVHDLTSTIESLKLKVKLLMDRKSTGSEVSGIITKDEVDQLRSFLKTHDGPKGNQSPPEGNKVGRSSRRNKNSQDESTKTNTSSPVESIREESPVVAQDEGQSIRDGLRTASTKNEVVILIGKAKELNLTYEQHIGEKLLSNWPSQA
jgi:hypothetical protein